MARTIDDKIVEMRFDNRDFEKNTKQSMATLDKLKTSLDMTDAERNFNKISKASGDMTFRKASDSADTFSVKLSAMSSVAVAAIGRITNKLIDLGEQFVKTLSGIDYISAGFSKYEDIIGYQQTMLANAKNLSEEQMQSLLDKLVWFSDETSFNADNMMQAMSSYISAGADELTAQAAALGTALWAALTGNSNESLAIANRNLPQIFGKGYMQLLDWQSIVTAKMDAPWIRDMFIETAGELKTLEKRADGFYTKIGKNWEKVDASSFTATFKGGWLTTEVLLKTFQKITKFTDSVYDEVNETGDLAFDVIRRLGKDIDDVGYKALKNAQETKTWSEAWEYVQGAVTAGWSRTFETIFGSFNTARDFFSDIVESLYTIFVEPGNERNNIFKSWAEYTPQVAKDTNDVATDVDDIVTKLEGAKEIVISIIRGNYGNGAVRVKALAEKYGAEVGKELQLVVNEVWKQWDGEHWSLNMELLDKITADGLITRKTADAIKAAADTISGTAESIEEAEEVLNGRDDFLDGLSALAEGIAAIFGRTNYWLGKDSSLKVMKLDAESLYNFTHKYAEKFRAFRDMVALPEDYDDTMRKLREGEITLDDIAEDERGYYTGEKGFKGDFIYTLVNNIGKLFSIIDNITQPLRKLFKSIGKGLIEALFHDGEKTMLDYQTGLLKFLTKVEELTRKFRLTEEQTNKLTTIFKGLFTPLRIIGKIISSVATAVTDVMAKTTKGLGEKTLFDRLLDIGEGIANIIIGFDEWLEESGLIENIIVPAITFVGDALKTVWDWVKKLLHVDSEKAFPTFDDIFKGWTNIKDWLHKHIIEPIEGTFNIDLHIPTWDEIMSKWGKIKDWVSKNVVTPFTEAFSKITGKKFEFHWPTFDDIKSGWEKAKDFVETRIIQPIEDLLGIDIRMPNLEDIKNFFSKIGEFFAKIFDNSDGESIFTRIGNAFGSLFGNGKRRGEGLGTGPVGEGAREFDLEMTDSVGAVSRASGKASTVSTVLEKLADAVKKIFKFIEDIVNSAKQSPTLNAAMKTGMFLVILEMISRLVDTAYKFLNFMPLLNIQLSLGMFVESLSDIFYSIAEVNKTKAVKNLATSVAILVASMFVLALIPVDSVREGVAVILELVAALGVIAIMLAKLSKIGSFSLSANKTGLSTYGTKSTVGNIGTTLLMLALSVVLLAHSLKSVAKIGNPAQLQGALLVIEELLFSMVAVMVIMNKQSKLIGRDQKLTTSSIQFFAIGLLISNLVKSIIKLSKVENYEKAFEAVQQLLIIIESMIVIIAYFASKSVPEADASKLVPKLVGPILAIAALILLLLAGIAVLTKVLKEEGDMKRFGIIADFVVKALAISVGIISAVALLAKAKGATVKIKDGTQFIKMALGISVLTAALSILLIAITASFAVLMHEIANGMTKDQMAYAGTMLLGIGALVLILVGVATAVLADSARWETSAPALLSVGVMLIAMAALVTSLTLSFAVLVKAVQGIDNPGALAIAAGGIALIIALILGSAILIIRSYSSSVHNLTNYSDLTNVGASSAQLLSIALILVILGRVVSKIAVALSKLFIAAAIVGDWGLLAAAGAALAVTMAAVLISLAAIIKSFYTFGAETRGAADALRLVSLALIIQSVATLVFAVGVALTMITHILTKEGNSWKSIIAPVASMVIVIAALLGAVAILNKMQMNGTNLMYVAGALTVLSLNLIAIAIALGALTAVIGNTNISGSNGASALIDAVKGIGLSMTILLAAAYVASNPVMERGFLNLTRLFIGISTIAASFAVAVGVVIIALLAFKDAVYDIADHYDKFEKGVLALFYTIAEAFEVSLPVLLSALVKTGDQIARALLEMGVQLAINIKRRLPDLIREAIQSFIVALSALDDYIGPFVAIIFEFVVEVVEGVAFAIVTRGGKLAAALLDVIGAIIVLTNTVLSGVLSGILKALGLDAVGDLVVGLLGIISDDTIQAMADAGDDVIAQAEKNGKNLIDHSPRLAAYYAKYGNMISTALNSGIAGVTAGAASSMTDLLGGTDLSSMFNLDMNNLGFDSDALTSFGLSSGKQYSAGVEDGLDKFTVDDMFPSLDEYYEYGKSSADAERSGYTNALQTGLETGSLKTIAQYNEWLKRTGADDENTRAINEAIEKGEINNNNFVEKALAIINASDKAAKEAKIQAKAIEDTKDYLEAGAKAAKYTEEVNRATGLQSTNRRSVDAALQALLLLDQSVTDTSTIPTETLTSLAELRDVLATYSGPEIDEALAIIDRLLGFSGKVGPINTGVIEEYGKRQKEENDKWEEARSKMQLNTEKNKKQAREAEEADRKAQIDAAIRHVASYSSGDFKKGIEITGEGYYMQMFDSLTNAARQNIVAMLDDPKLEKVYLSKLSENGKKVYAWFKEHFADYAMLNEHGNASVSWLLEDFGTGKQQYKAMLDEIYGPYYEYVYELYGYLPTFFHDELAKYAPQLIAEFPDIDFTQVLSKEDFDKVMAFLMSMGIDIGDNFVRGVIAGLNLDVNKSGRTGIDKATYSIANAVTIGTKNKLDIQSPSGVGEEIGDFFVQGVAKGISDNASLAGDESEDMGVSMWQHLKAAISSAVGFNLDDLSPVIRPILDLDNIVSGADQINSLVGGNVYGRGVGLGIGSVGYGDLQAIAQLNKTGMAQAIQESMLSQPVNQTFTNTFNIQSNDPNEVARRVSAILSNQIERKNQVWGPARVTRATQ